MSCCANYSLCICTTKLLCVKPSYFYLYSSLLALLVHGHWLIGIRVYACILVPVMPLWCWYCRKGGKDKPCNSNIDTSLCRPTQHACFLWSYCLTMFVVLLLCYLVVAIGYWNGQGYDSCTGQCTLTEVSDEYVSKSMGNMHVVAVYKIIGSLYMYMFYLKHLCVCTLCTATSIQ